MTLGTPEAAGGNDHVRLTAEELNPSSRSMNYARCCREDETVGFRVVLLLSYSHVSLAVSYPQRRELKTDSQEEKKK
jgi:hypothetical protein